MLHKAGRSYNVWLQSIVKHVSIYVVPGLWRPRVTAMMSCCKSGKLSKFARVCRRQTTTTYITLLACIIRPWSLQSIAMSGPTPRIRRTIFLPVWAAPEEMSTRVIGNNACKAQWLQGHYQRKEKRKQGKIYLCGLNYLTCSVSIEGHIALHGFYWCRIHIICDHRTYILQLQIRIRCLNR